MPDDKYFVFVERQKALQLAESCGLGIIKEEDYLVGYQVYIIEQWMCDRRIASNTIKVFTGDQNHKIKVCVISISTADLQHPRPEVQSFFDTTTPLKFKSTPLGEIMLTDPSELPYDMDMVLVPDGDYDHWINQAYVNINLRRTNCTGRSALNLNKPNPASEEKFRSIYKIADAVSFESAVINLVRVAQIALYLFNLLKKDYIDGLICNETTKALWEFYTKYNPHKSPEYQLKEPWLEPHLLAALISKLVVCRNKLHAYNFTTIKDPFADYEHFRFDIEEYQRVKNLKRTKFIDLETLEKLNEYTISQLRVRKVIKSKLDDISGVSNSPLFSEAADPEVFRHHATIESLRAIWRPRLKSVSSDVEKHQHEFLHMIKGVGARTTRTSGAAAEIISKFAGSLPWIETRQSHSRTGSKTHANDSPSSTSGSSPMRGSVSPAYPTTASVQLTTTTPSGVSTVEDILYAPPRQDQNRYQEHSGVDLASSSEDELYSESYRSDSDIPSWPIIPERMVAQAERSTSPREGHPASVVDDEHNHIRPDSSSPTSDFNHAGFVRSARPHHIPRRSRSVSDSIVPASTFSADYHTSPVRPKRFILHRANSLATIPVYHGSDSDDLVSDSGESSPPLRPSVTMDIQTYLMYERLQRQHAALRKLYSELQKMASVYEHRAAQLRATYIRRAAEFEQIERAARRAIEEQEDTERRLKEVEDGSAKLHYELNVLNDHLKDIEDNVSTFYGKVGLLEQKMQDSQQSITTMLIIGNYFNYYWQKMKRWVGL